MLNIIVDLELQNEFDNIDILSIDEIEELCEHIGMVSKRYKLRQMKQGKYRVKRNWFIRDLL